MPELARHSEYLQSQTCMMQNLILFVEIVLNMVTWHDLAIGEVTSEEIIICCDIFVAHCILLRLELHHPINKQEWKPVHIRWQCKEASCRKVQHPHPHGVQLQLNPPRSD